MLLRKVVGTITQSGDTMSHGKTPSAVQTACLQAWARGDNLIVQAVPGAGKSWLLIEACRCFLAQHDGEEATIVVYNRELQADVTALVLDAGLQESVRCFTFHSLFSYCVSLAPDDDALQALLSKVVHGTQMVHPLHMAALLVDEAQDVNSLHVQVLRHCIALKPHAQVCVVGDARQELYDYGEFPSLSSFLDDPSDVFPSTRVWHRAFFSMSHRLTLPMATLLQTHFGVEITSAMGSESDLRGTPVALHSCDEFKVGGVIEGILREHESTVSIDSISILAATKTFNMALRVAMNHLSAGGVPLYVHGIDLADPRVRANKLRVSSWHSSKGTECAVNIVLMPAASKDNPLYVAWSRGNAHLHLIFIRDRLEPRILSSLARLPHEYRDARDEFMARAIDAANASSSCLEAGDAPASATFAQGAVRYRSLDVWRINTGVLRKARVLTGVTDVQPSVPLPHTATIVSTVAGSEDVANIYEMVLRLRFEERASGHIRFVQDILFPCRLPIPDQANAIALGHQARFVSQRMRSSSLLPEDLTVLVSAAYANREKTNGDWALLACACLSWNSYHHTMRQVLPITWVDDSRLDAAWKRLLTFFEGEATHECAQIYFDYRLFRGEPTPMHVRCHVFTNECAYHLVWSDLNASHRADACLRAAMHPLGLCRLFSMTSGAVDTIDASDRDDVLAELD